MTMRPSSRPNVPALIAMSIVLVSLGIAACVSERATSSATVSTATCSAPSNTAGATIVFIRDFVFLPASVHVKAGGSVAWVNCEPTAVPHTSTSDGSGWNSGSLAPGAAFVRAFPTAGSFPYHCDIHPGMKATVIVD
jgi:plastocyanin